jgi:hypothetical protein
MMTSRSTTSFVERLDWTLLGRAPHETSIFEDYADPEAPEYRWPWLRPSLSLIGRVGTVRRVGNAVTALQLRAPLCRMCLAKNPPIATATVADHWKVIAAISITFCSANCKVSVTTATRRRSSGAAARPLMTSNTLKARARRAAQKIGFPAAGSGALLW